MSRQFVLIYGIVACVLALAGLLYTNGFVSAVGMQNLNGIGQASPWPSALLSVLVLLTGFAGLVHLVAWRGEQLSPRPASDALALMLIAIICYLCLLASLWAAFSGADPSANLL